ncbi:unnamed protein product [Schistocephalus solidus]|uniref:Endonuclease/exonuclease/phosphatase domain-containing protein n=1 Tax=Schistocephalus solidus TaxID=70667 RepID=A0A183SII6_SCHSO|nr:unnamed protein product [Schistocephalus solidus]
MHSTKPYSPSKANGRSWMPGIPSTGKAANRQSNPYAGVGFATLTDIVERLHCLPQGLKDRLISLRLPLRGDTFAIIISTYTLPMPSFQKARNEFYEDLHALLATVPKAHKLIVLCDFNAGVGTGHATYRGKLGPMVPTASRAVHRFILSSIFFYLPMLQKATWMHTLVEALAPS